jgi:hypothetical protein
VEEVSLRSVYNDARQKALIGQKIITGRQAKLEESFVNLPAAEWQTASPDMTQSYRSAMRNEADGWRKFKNKVYFCSWSVSALFLGFGVLSRWAPRWRNGLSLFNGVGAVVTFGIGHKTAQICNGKEKNSEDKAEADLFDIYSPDERTRLKHLVVDGEFTEAIDQFAGQSYVARGSGPRAAWTTPTLLAEDLLNLNYNLFGIKGENKFSQVTKLWELRAIAVGYAAAKQEYERDLNGLRTQFNDLCSDINEHAKAYLPAT